VNGKSWPYMEVEPRRYRFRIVNGSNARFLIMQLFNQNGVDMHTNGTPGPAAWLIGTDGGFLNSRVKLDDPAHGPHAGAGGPIGNMLQPRRAMNRLLLARGERNEIIVNFSG